MRQFFFSVYSLLQMQARFQKKRAMRISPGIAAKATKEAKYHVRHSAQWVVTLGDGTGRKKPRTHTARGGRSLALHRRAAFIADDVDREVVVVGTWRRSQHARGCVAHPGGRRADARHAHDAVLVTYKVARRPHRKAYRAPRTHALGDADRRASHPGASSGDTRGWTRTTPSRATSCSRFSIRREGPRSAGVERDFDAVRDKAQDLLWPENLDEARWADVADRYVEQPGMPWLPPKGLDTLKLIACNRGLWEDLGNGYVTKKPKKKRTSVQVIAESEPDDEGKVRLRVNPQNAGPAPRVHYAADAPVTEASPQLKDPILTTAALRVNFLVCDPSGQYETGDPVTWSNKLVIRSQLSEKGAKRTVELLVAPRGSIRYTLDGSSPREGTPYSGAIAIGNGEVLLLAFAEADKIETRQEFRFPAKGQKGVQIDEVKPGRLVSRTGRKLDSRAKTFEGLKQAAEKSASFEGVAVMVGQGNQIIGVTIGEIAVDAPFIEALLAKVLEKFPPDTPITMTFRKGHFPSGHDLKDFAGKLGIELRQGDVEQ